MASHRAFNPLPRAGIQAQDAGPTSGDLETSGRGRLGCLRRRTNTKKLARRGGGFRRQLIGGCISTGCPGVGYPGKPARLVDVMSESWGELEVVLVLCE